MHLKILTVSLLLATATAVPAISQAPTSNDHLLLQINVGQITASGDGSPWCADLCEQRHMFCDKACETEACKTKW
jgi:hypothetical protein